jgi:hypothetical protein
MSAPRTASSTEGTARAFISRARRSAHAASMSYARTSSIRRTARSASTLARPCAPQPITARIFASARARNFAATAVAAAVRSAVISVESRIASVMPALDIHDHNHSPNRRQPMRGRIVGKVRVDLRREHVAKRRLDVKRSARRVEADTFRRRCPSFAVTSKRFFHGLEAIGRSENGGDVVACEKARHAAASSAGGRSMITCELACACRAPHGDRRR